MREVIFAGDQASTMNCPGMPPRSLQQRTMVGPNGNVAAFGTSGQSKGFVDTKFGAGRTTGSDAHSSVGFDAIHGTMTALRAQPACG